MTLAEKIRLLCKENHTSVHKLEVELGFGNGYIKRLVDTIPMDRAVKIAEYFNIPIDTLFPTKKEPAPANPLIDEILVKASNFTEAELQELLSFANYIQSKH